MDLMVVDNHSTDESPGRIREAFPEVPLVCSAVNRGYCGGNNLALEMGLKQGYDCVVVANHDIELAPDAIERLVRVASQTSLVGVVGGREVSLSGQSRALGGRGYNYWFSRRHWLKPGDEGTDGEKPFLVDYVQGALVLFTRLALQKGVRLNEAMFAYVDEIELGLQLARAGLRVYVDPMVIVRHRGRPERFSPGEGYFTQRNRWYIVRHYGKWYHRAFCLLYASLVELPFKYAYRSLQGHRRFARACILGFLDGLRGVGGIGRYESL